RIGVRAAPDSRLGGLFPAPLLGRHFRDSSAPQTPLGMTAAARLQSANAAGPTPLRRFHSEPIKLCTVRMCKTLVTGFWAIDGVDLMMDHCRRRVPSCESQTLWRLHTAPPDLPAAGQRSGRGSWHV